MKRHKSFLLLSMCLVILLIGAVTLAGCGPNEQSNGEGDEAQDETFILRFAGDMPITHHISEQMITFEEKLLEKCGDRVSLELYPAAQLIAHTKIPEAVSSGAVDLGTCDSSNMGGISEAVVMSSMSFLIKDWDDCLELHQKYFDLIDSEFQQKGVKLLYWVPYGVDRGPLTTDKKVTTLEDLKGLQIRGIGEIGSKWIEGAGAVPVFIDSGEVYQALATGAIDGSMSGYGSYFTRRWYEVGKYVVGTGYNYCVYPTIMNLNKWNKLPKDIQDALISVGEEVTKEYFIEVEKTEIEYEKGLIDGGVEIYMLPEEELAKWKEPMQAIYDEWAQRSPACKEIMDYLSTR